MNQNDGLSEHERNVKALMLMTLEVAIPIWVNSLKHLPWSYLAEQAGKCAGIVAEKGDILQYRSSVKGETAKAFNALAEGLAILSFCPGGVKFMGRHWENKHTDSPGQPMLRRYRGLYMLSLQRLT